MSSALQGSLITCFAEAAQERETIRSRCRGLVPLSRTSRRRPEGKTVKTIHQTWEHSRGVGVESQKLLRRRCWEKSAGMTAKTGSQETKISGWSWSSAAEGQTQRLKPCMYCQRDHGPIWPPKAATLRTSACNKWRDWWAARPHGATRGSTTRRSSADSGRKWWQMRAWGGKEYNWLREWTTLYGSRHISANEARPLLRDSAAYRISSRIIRDRSLVRWMKGILWIYWKCPSADVFQEWLDGLSVHRIQQLMNNCQPTPSHPKHAPRRFYVEAQRDKWVKNKDICRFTWK